MTPASWPDSDAATLLTSAVLCPCVKATTSAFWLDSDAAIGLTSVLGVVALLWRRIHRWVSTLQFRGPRGQRHASTSPTWRRRRLLPRRGAQSIPSFCNRCLSRLRRATAVSHRTWPTVALVAQVASATALSTVIVCLCPAAAMKGTFRAGHASLADVAPKIAGCGITGSSGRRPLQVRHAEQRSLELGIGTCPAPGEGRLPPPS